MKLAILSDTHGLLRPEVTEHLKTADAILHGGDITRQSIVDELRQYAPLYIVRGNNDKDWAEAIPHDLTVTLGGVTFFMVHNRKEVPADGSGEEGGVIRRVQPVVCDVPDDGGRLLPVDEPGGLEEEILRIQAEHGKCLRGYALENGCRSGTGQAGFLHQPAH